MGIWTIIKNAGLILSVIREIQAIVERAVKSDRKLPSCDDSKVLIGQFRKLLERKVIDIPGVDETELIVALSDLESNIVCSVDQAHRNVQKFGQIKPVVGGVGVKNEA